MSEEEQLEREADRVAGEKDLTVGVLSKAGTAVEAILEGTEGERDRRRHEG